MANLTEARCELTFEYLVKYIDEHGYSPSMRDIAQGIGTTSTSEVLRYLLMLEDARRIKRASNRARSIVIPQQRVAA